MPKNDALKKAVVNRAVLISANPVSRNKALDDLLKANPAEIKDFRTAIINHKGFWQLFPDLKEADADKFYDDNDTFLTMNGPPDIKEIRQAAAEQRVMLGLKDASDDVLVHILANNQDECRAYLASKPELGNLDKAHGWKKDETPDPSILPPRPANKSTDVLSDVAIDNIKFQSRDLLLSRLIAKTENLAFLDQLLTAKDKSTVEAAATQLGYPQAVKNLLHYPVSDEVTEALTKRMDELEQKRDDLLSSLITQSENRGFLVQLHTATDKGTLEAAAIQLGYPQSDKNQLTHPLSDEVKEVLAKRMNELKQIEGKNTFQTHVDSLSTDELLRKKAALEGVNEEFKGKFIPQVTLELADQDIPWAKGVLGLRYIQAVLANTKKDLLPALQTTNEDELKDKLKVLLGGNHAYIDHAVKDNVGTIKKALLISRINNQVTDFDSLKKLDEAPDIEKFREALVAQGIKPADWVQSEDSNDIKQAIRARHFELQLAKVSQLGANPHPQLINAFKELSVSKQRELLKDPAHHYHLLNAKDTKTLAHYLGKDAKGLAEVVAENQKLAVFQTIHNSVVAQILVNFKPEINLTAAQIAEINKELDRAVLDPTNVFSDKGKYKVLIDKIGAQCGPVDVRAFNEAFGLTADGANFLASPSVRDDIIKQNTNNLDILRASTLLPDKSTNKKLLEVFLTLDKSTPIDPNVIKDKFTSSKTYKEFIEGIAPNNLALRVQLSSQLTSSMFYEMKNEVIKSQFLSSDPGTVKKAVAQVEEVINDAQEQRKTSTKSMEHFKFIEQIEPHHLYNPSFRGAARDNATKMKGHYQALSDDCDVIVDQLRRNLNSLQGFLELRGKLDQNLPPSEKDKVAELARKLNEEIAAVKAELKYYERIQQKLSGDNGILQAISDAADNKKAYVFHAKGVTRKIVSREEISGLQYASIPAVQNTVISTNGQAANAQKFLLSDEIIPKGKIAVIDVVNTEYQADKTTKAYESRGRYTIDLSQPAELSQKGDTNPGGKIEIEEFPKQTTPPPVPDSEEDIKLTKDKIAFALSVAADTIALLDSPPTKDKPLVITSASTEETAYIWTALLVLGENNPHMKFGEDAIKFDRYGENTFNPEQEKSKLLGFNTGFHEKSLYQKFKSAEHQSEVQRKSEAVNKMSEEKMNPLAKRAEIDAVAIKAHNALKGELISYKQEAKKSKDMEGPATTHAGPKNT